MRRLFIPVAFSLLTALPCSAQDSAVNDFFNYVQELNSPYWVPYYNPCALSPCLPLQGEVFPTPEVEVNNEVNVYITPEEPKKPFEDTWQLPDSYYNYYHDSRTPKEIRPSFGGEPVPEGYLPPVSNVYEVED